LTAWYEDAFWLQYLWLYPHRDDAEAAAEIGILAGKAPGLAPGRRVLDLACGAGRHLRAMADAGIRAVGADLSPDLLAAAAERGSKCIVRCDMRRLPFRDGAFDAVTLFFQSFGYFDDDAEDAEVLRGAARVLAPGGGLVLDLLDADRVRRGLVARSERREGERRIVEERSLADGGRRVEKRVTATEGGRERTWRESVRLYSGEEAERMAAGAGLRPHARLDPPAGKGAPRVLHVFEKAPA
jgi:SAM-dependent methyltransferase